MVCYNCFKEKSSYGPCPFCGYDPAGAEEKYPLALKAGSILNGRYTVGRVIGQGGFGITYIAQDYQTKERVAIKEFLPTDFAGRDSASSSVKIYSGERRENFEYGKEQFLQEAKTLAAFIGDEHIVRIYSYFEENNTAYFVMEYVDGYALDKYMAQKGGRLSVEEANHLLLPLMPSLDKVHSKGIIHRDIAPDNIIVTKDGSAKLIDFGAARYSTGEKSKSLDVILKHGFAPKEQYLRRGRQGPYTDIYALAATWYYAITGKVPPESIERMDYDNLIPPSSLGVKLSGKTEDALFKALEVNPQDRFQSMGEFHAAMEQSASQHPSEYAQVSQNKVPKTGLSAREEAALLEKRLQELRAEAERQEREEKERLAREEAARREQERKEREAREEAARLERERKEREAREAEERRKKELAEKKTREEAERQEKLRLEKERREEEKRLAAEKKKQEAAEKERLRQEAIAKRKAEQEQQRLAAEQKKQTTSEKKASSKKPVIAIIAALLVAAVAVGYFLSSGTKKPEETPLPQETAQPSPTAEQAKPIAELPAQQVTEQTEPSEKTEEQSEPAEEKTEQSEQAEEQTEQTEQSEQIEEAGPGRTPEDYYAEGVALQAAGDWNGAIAAFAEAGDYEDSGEHIQEIQKELQYQEAIDCMNAGQYREALSAFEELKESGFKDSAERVEEIKHLGEYRAQFLAEAQVGDVVFFGEYEQDNNLDNGKETIDWLVLAREDNRVLLISQHALDSQPYHTEYTNVTWETCSLRSWLNSAFMDAAFTENEKDLVPAVSLSDDNNPVFNTDPGNDTVDQVFLLSIPEVNTYLSDGAGAQCTPTDYAKAQGCNVTAYDNSCWWWLRSPGSINGNNSYRPMWYGSSDEINTAGVGSSGAVNYNGYRITSMKGAVRPALWVDISKAADTQPEQAEEAAENESKPIQKDLLTAGSIITFGAYEQDNDLENGKEPIEWIVLDVQDEKSLLISKYGLDVKAYNDIYTSVTWEECTLRNWLNSEFLNDAFSSDEQQFILTTNVDNSRAQENSNWISSGGNNTEDKVFLLSYAEANQFFSSDIDRVCEPTAYELSKDLWASNFGHCQWLLRSPGSSRFGAAQVFPDGHLGEYHVNFSVAVRPVIWIDSSAF